MEFIIASNKLVHFTVQGLIGGGGLSYYCDWYTDDWDPHKGDAFFALEPSANVMLNLHKYIRLGIGGSYRYINGVNYGDLTDSDLSGATVQFIAKFGTF
jgi:hypothetical protein